MSDAAAALAAPIVLRHKEKDYPLSPLTLDDLAMFERWLENRALEAVQARKEQVPEEDYQRLLSIWLSHCVEGKFRYGGDIAREAGGSPDGIKFLFFLQLAKQTPAMTQKLAAQILDANAVEIMAMLKVVNADPLAEAGPVATPEPAK